MKPTKFEKFMVVVIFVLAMCALWTVALIAINVAKSEAVKSALIESAK